jgi:two-component system response regulator NreC
MHPEVIQVSPSRQNRSDRVRVLIADDHEVVRSGLRLVFESSEHFEIVGEAADGRQLLDLATTIAADLVIVDISMPGMGGIEATRLLRLALPALKILTLTVHADEEYIFQMLKAGANGYLLKSAGKEEIFQATNAVLGGSTFFSPTVSDIIVQGFIQRAEAEQRGPAAVPPMLANGAPTPDAGSSAEVLPIPPAAADRIASPLTKRETEVLRLIAQGMTNRAIGETLFISARTVNTHRTNLMQKLDLHDTASLVRFAIANGLLPADPDSPVA